MVVKEGVEDTAREVFHDSDIHIITDGHRYLGGVIGSEAFEQHFLQQKVQDWISDIKKLSTIAESQPHAAYSAFCHGLSFRWNYFFRVCTSSSLFQPLEDCICSDLIPKLLGRDIPGKVEQDLFSLPVQLGGFGLFIPTITAARQHTCSLHTSSPLVDLIVSQAPVADLGLLKGGFQCNITIVTTNGMQSMPNWGVWGHAPRENFAK